MFDFIGIKILHTPKGKNETTLIFFVGRKTPQISFWSVYYRFLYDFLPFLLCVLLPRFLCDLLCVLPPYFL